MLHLRRVTCKEYEDQADIVVDVGLTYPLGTIRTAAPDDRLALAELTNAIEASVRDFMENQR